MDELIGKFENTKVFCGEDEYEELVRNNKIFQTSSYLHQDFLVYIFDKMKYYHRNLNFEHSKRELPEYSAELDYLKHQLNIFMNSNDVIEKANICKCFHERLMDTLIGIFFCDMNF